MKSEINWRTFEVGVFWSEGTTNQFQVVMYLQVVINISFQVVLTFVLYWYLFKLLFTSFTSTRCRLFTSTRCLCVTICLQVVTSSCINTFGNDVAARSMTYHYVRKSRSEMTWRSTKRSTKTGLKNISHTTHGNKMWLHSRCHNVN